VADADALDELRERVRATTEAAERLVREVPPQGWATPQQRAAAADEAQALITLLQALRDVVPPELWEQVRETIRQLLLLLRAVLDYAVERLEHERPPRGADGPDLQDIPVA
jgi:hypothetical protein